MAERRVGIIGGSGLYSMEGLENQRWVKVETPFGEPSDEYLIGRLGEREVVFLPRHGRGHRIMPSELNYCANIYGMKKLGVEWVISISAVGSFREDLKPLDIVLPDQFIDRTRKARRDTFFGEGVVAHIPFAEPICSALRKLLYQAGQKIGATIHNGGTYLNMEGPAFSTKAESLLHKSWGMDIIGMTNMLEAKVAREAEICFATMAMVTDYDAWREEEKGSFVTIDMVIQNLQKNTRKAKDMIETVVPMISNERKCECATALENTIITRSNLIPEKRKKDLELIIGKYL